jgi:prevent-host-death family protein
MKVAGVAELKARLSRYLESVKGGEEVTVTDRGRPVARLIPLDPSGSGDERLGELARQGLVRLPRSPIAPEKILARQRPEDPEGRTLDALLDERGRSW